MNILVTGATGYIGGRLVPRLVAAGYHVICMARDPQRLAGRRWERVEIRQGDVRDPNSLRRVLDGVDVAYYLVHSMATGDRDYGKRDRLGAKHFGAAARAVHVQRIIYLGGLGTDDKRLSPHLASRHEVGHVLRASGVPVTEFRAAVVVGSGSISFEMIRYLTERLPVIVTSRWVTTRCQPIAIGNVLDYLIRCLGEPRSIGRSRRTCVRIGSVSSPRFQPRIHTRSSRVCATRSSCGTRVRVTSSISISFHTPKPYDARRSVSGWARSKPTGPEHRWDFSPA